MKALLNEAFAFKKYKAMHPFFAVVTGLAMIPFVLFSFIAVAWLAVASFVFKAVRTPIEFLHSLVKKEGSEVHFVTQVVIYLISWLPLLFFYALASFIILHITAAYALTSVLLYIWSLGGFKFHLFVSESEDISLEVEGGYCKLPIFFSVISLMLLLVAPAIHGVLLYAELYSNYLEDTFTLDYYGSYLALSVFFSLLYSLIGFAPRPTASVTECEDAEEEITVEIVEIEESTEAELCEEECEEVAKETEETEIPAKKTEPSSESTDEE